MVEKNKGGGKQGGGKAPYQGQSARNRSRTEPAQSWEDQGSGWNKSGKGKGLGKNQSWNQGGEEGSASRSRSSVTYGICWICYREQLHAEHFFKLCPYRDDFLRRRDAGLEPPPMQPSSKGKVGAAKGFGAPAPATTSVPNVSAASSSSQHQ